MMLKHGLKTTYSLARGRGPRQLVVQLTDACNARCPQCGMRASAGFKRSRLDRSALRRVIAHAARQGVQAISFTGGEPFLYQDDLFASILYAKECGIRFTRTGTNGLPFLQPDSADFLPRVERFADQLAASGLDNLWISLDSADVAVHEASRGLPGVVRGVEQALPILARHGLYPTANVGLNRLLGGTLPPRQLDVEEAYAFYRDGLSRLFERAIGLGFTILNCCYPMTSTDGTEARAASVYQATADHEMIAFPAAELDGLYRALFDLLPLYRQEIRIFTPRSSLYSLMAERRAPGSCARGCRGGSDYLFVSSADGHAYPCGYRGEDDLGPFVDLRMDRLRQRSHCTRCEWECFRDPTELFGPLQEVVARPFSLLRHCRRHPEFYRLWLEDLRYALAAGFFSGRSAPRREKLLGSATVRA